MAKLNDQIYDAVFNLVTIVKQICQITSSEM